MDSGARLWSCDELRRAQEAGEEPVVVCVGQGPPKPAAPIILGAIYMDTAEIEQWSDDMPHGTGNLLPDPVLRRVFEAHGLTANTRAYVYTEDFKHGGSDPIAATRLVWALCYAGVAEAGLIDGGIAEWTARGFPLADAPRVPARRGFFGSSGRGLFPARSWLLASTEEVEAALPSSCSAGLAERRAAVIADVRSWDEFTGLSHDYAYFEALGRIRGARWAHWGPSTYVGGDFVECEASCRLRPLEQISRIWADWGIAPALAEGGRVIFYCGSGWRSSFAWFIAALLGWHNAANYDGGWLEWSTCHPRAAELPKARGQPDKGEKCFEYSRSGD